MNSLSLARGSLLDNRYIIRQLLAQGGVAEVYWARHRFTDRDVVVKIPRLTMASASGVRERFEREARVLSHMRLPGLVELLDVGEHAGALYLVLEHLQGRTLGGLLTARGRLDPADAVSIGLSLSKVLGQCHRLGIIHGDVRPDNVFMLRGAESRLKLFDLGLAHRVSDATPNASRNSQEVSLSGTPECMAPEALLMQPGVDHRVDIYALGVLLYELLCGAVPFEGSYRDILFKMATLKAPPLRAVRPDLPEALLSAVDHCLARDPRERFASMASVMEALAQAAVELAADRQVESVVISRGRAPITELPCWRRNPLEPMPRSGKDVRRHRRAPFTMSATLSVGGVSLYGRVEEISVGGVQFVFDTSRQVALDTVEIGGRAALEFALPITGQVCQVPGTVRWRRTARGGRHVVGFSFLELPDEAKQAIQDYVTFEDDPRLGCTDGQQRATASAKTPAMP